jgi:Plant transposon protein
VRTAILTLAIGTCADSADPEMGTLDSSAMQCMKIISKEIVSRFSEEYLRQPTESDLNRIMSLYAARGFPACIECIDCQHYSWEAFRTGLAGQFKGKRQKVPLFLRGSQIRNFGYGMFTSGVQDR